MADEIASINLNTAAEALRDKIRLSFVELIPNEKWNAMIQAELKKFFTDTVTRNYMGEHVNPSPFATIVRKEIEDHVKGIVREQLNSPEYQTRFTGSGHEVSTAIKEWMDKNHTKIVETAIEYLIGNGIQHVLMMAKSQ